MKYRKSFDIEKYNYYVDEYIRKSKEIGKPISNLNLRKPEFNLPDSRWYVKNCKDNSVKTWADFISWCGFPSRNHRLSKEETIRLIYEMRNNLNRPLMYDDFRGVDCNKPSIESINRIWGSINKMKEELGLEVIQESMMDKKLDKETFDHYIKIISDSVIEDGRDFITSREIKIHSEYPSMSTLIKYSKIYYDCGLSEIFYKYGIRLGKQGRGINFDFDDGERATSQFEYMFSKFLREQNLTFEKDYFRNVKYSSFIDSYNGNMDCDYVININGENVYIEIAGIIDGYKEFYYQNKEIAKRKSREKYRLKLRYKESMLNENNLKYFILFPCDLTTNNFSSILISPSLKLKHDIEAFNKNNIDWIKVRETGKLKYSDNIKWGRSQIQYDDVV